MAMENLIQKLGERALVKLGRKQEKNKEYELLARKIIPELSKAISGNYAGHVEVGLRDGNPYVYVGTLDWNEHGSPYLKCKLHYNHEKDYYWPTNCFAHRVVSISISSKADQLRALNRVLRTTPFFGGDNDVIHFVYVDSRSVDDPSFYGKFEELGKISDLGFDSTEEKVAAVNKALAKLGLPLTSVAAAKEKR